MIASVIAATEVAVHRRSVSLAPEFHEEGPHDIETQVFVFARE